MKPNPVVLALVVTVGCGALISSLAQAHCDTLDGPVVQAARVALEKGDVNRVLVWVKPADETPIREAFRQTIAVRRLGPDAKALADRWFFETLVRLHRAGEGAPYTGLKPAGSDFGPAIPAADRALETGDLTPLTNLIDEASRKSLETRFKAARAAKQYSPGNVTAGREYVECYVSFIHQAEGLWQAATRSSEEHFEEEAVVTPAHEHH